MRKTYRSLLAASFCLLLLFVTACGSSESGNTPAAAEDSTGSAGAEKAIYIGMVNPPVTLNPINLTDAASIFVSGFMFDTLLALTEDFEFLPKLAESVESADSQTYTVKLNPNAKWSDGEAFTTKDVEFTLNLVANPLVESMLRLKFIEGLNDAGKLDEGQTAISGLKIIDEHTFEIKTKTPVDPNYFNDNFSTRLRFLPEHVLSGVAPADLATNAYMQNPSVTLGAFTFGKFAKDQYVEVSANPDYYQG
ncbi:ABC transporter substrate-binding protein, partial [Paenibacillus ihuae]|uniref:ABC transporter substrate-binding protein n=1 Tax=Paenibacillus ihuae TaxID=1232431 RepID=UPI001FD7F8C8